MPRKIRQLIKDLKKAGFEFMPGKGSHRKFYHPLTKQVVIVSGGLGDDVHRYQERDLQRAVDAVKKQQEQP